MHTPLTGHCSWGPQGFGSVGGSVLPPQVTAMPCNAAWKSYEVETVLSSFGLLAEEDTEDCKVLGCWGRY